MTETAPNAIPRADKSRAHSYWTVRRYGDSPEVLAECEQAKGCDQATKAHTADECDRDLLSSLLAGYVISPTHGVSLIVSIRTVQSCSSGGQWAAPETHVCQSAVESSSFCHRMASTGKMPSVRQHEDMECCEVEARRPL